MQSRSEAAAQVVVVVMSVAAVVAAPQHYGGPTNTGAIGFFKLLNVTQVTLTNEGFRE